MPKSIVSRCTIGAMASKNASAVFAADARIVSASAREVRGPVAMITLSHSGGNLENFLAAYRDKRLALKRRGDRGGEPDPGRPRALHRPEACGRWLRASPAILAGAFPHGGRLWRCLGRRRNGMNSSRRARRNLPFCAPQSSAGAAFRAALPGRRGAPAARPLRSPRARRRQHEQAGKSASSASN